MKLEKNNLTVSNGREHDGWVIFTPPGWMNQAEIESKKRTVKWKYGGETKKKTKKPTWCLGGGGLKVTSTWRWKIWRNYEINHPSIKIFFFVLSLLPNTRKKEKKKWTLEVA